MEISIEKQIDMKRYFKRTGPSNSTFRGGNVYLSIGMDDRWIYFENRYTGLRSHFEEVTDKIESGIKSALDQCRAEFDARRNVSEESKRFAEEAFKEMTTWMN